jgi:hypothetical protein
MRTPTLLQSLTLPPGAHPRGQVHLSAASGLVVAGSWLYLVADDEHHLGALPLAAADAVPHEALPLQLHRLLPGELPHDAAARKKRKPDLEALAVLPASARHPRGALLAMGSGSRPNRQQAFVWALDAAGGLAGAARAVDLSALYAPLRQAGGFADLNIEGAFVGGASLCVLQRGHQGDARNACIQYALGDIVDWLDRPDTETDRPPPAPSRIADCALGQVGGVALGFTDGCPLPGGGWLFSAVAEDTSDSYADGVCAGSVIGWVDAQGRLREMVGLAGAPKVEGLALHGGELLMVTDADDPGTASQLLSIAHDAAWAS